jgi:hypothetical protein
VGRRRVLLPQGIHGGLGTGAVAHGLHAADETAFLDDQFTVRGEARVWAIGLVSLPEPGAPLRATPAFKLFELSRQFA